MEREKKKHGAGPVAQACCSPAIFLSHRRHREVARVHDATLQPVLKKLATLARGGEGSTVVARRVRARARRASRRYWLAEPLIGRCRASSRRRLREQRG